MRSHEFTRSYQQDPIRRGDRVRDTKTDKEYKVYGVEGSEIVINSDGDTLPEHRLKKIKKSKDKLDEFAPRGGGGGGDDGNSRVFHAVLYNKSNGEFAHEEFVDTNEDNARDRVMIGYRGWKLIALWQNGQPPISTRTTTKTAWFVEYQDGDKKKMRLLSLSGGITTESKAREYLATYYPSWHITMLRRMR